MAGKKYLLNQQYFKPNYYKALEYILPQYLKDDDIETFGTTDDLEDQIINHNIDAATNIGTLLNISSIAGTTYSAMGTIGGIAPYFVKQNRLTDITPARFEKDILNKLNYSFASYQTSDAFANFVSATLLPSIALNDPAAQFETTHSTSDTHIYLTENLSWMYFLNTSGAGYHPSSFVTEQLVHKLYRGDSIQINDGIKGLAEYVWKTAQDSYYPTTFASGTDTWTSGTQQLENLQTWLDVIYSPLHADSSDFNVRDKFEMFIDSNVKAHETVPNGPFTKLLRALSFLAFDINNDSELLSTLYDIEDCPDDLLPLVAELIGWDLFGSDPERWRLQIRNAVDIYKSVGTKKSLQFTLNTIFPKDAFPIESRITELFESYVPFLIYYALATESYRFKSFATWNPQVASEMGVSGYSTSSLDENVRLAVDKILLETYEQFPKKFITFPNKEKGFYYRGRTYPIPPFEEYPYYVNVELDPDMLEFITDRLVCFGVRQEFALDTSGYIKANTLDVDEEPRAGSMLFFTSGYNDPPNLKTLILNLNDTKFEYVSLWSGKSSHFKLVFDASEFDFLKTGVDLGDVDSQDAFFIASKITNKMAPAHSIPLVSLELSTSDTLSYTASTLPLVALDKVEVDPIASRNYVQQGQVLGSYKRGIEPNGAEVKRGDTNNLYTDVYLGSVSANFVARNTLRRRSLEKIMPLNGYYDRTGFNMPVSYYMTSSLSGLPLGFIPSSCEYEDITDYVNLPEVYSRCQTISSTNSFNGFAVSDALHTRGHVGLGMVSKHMDRGQLPPIYDAMHSIQEKQKVIEAEVSYGDVSGQIESVSNVYQSEANRLTELSGFPNSVSDYYNFSFGRDISRLYQIYTSHFERHAIAPHIAELDGTNLFSHAWGPILRNHDFETLSTGFEGAVVSSLANITKLSPISQQFTGALSYEATAATDMYLDTPERVLSGLIDGIELIHTSGSYHSNEFSVFRIDDGFKVAGDDPYMFNRTFISSRSTGNGLSRVRFDMNKYGQHATSPVQQTFLLPDHKFKCTVKATLTNSTGTSFGNNRQFGIWIHTKPEEGNMWSFVEGSWVQHSQLATKQEAIDYATIFKFPVRTKEEVEEEEGKKLKCLELTAVNIPNSPVSRISETDFTEFDLTFDTANRLMRLPLQYANSHLQLHRTNQEYVVEVFLLPTPALDEFMIIDNVQLQDTTLKTMTEKHVGGKYQDPLCCLPYVRGGCKEYRTPLSKDELMKVFRFFNTIAGKNSAPGYASRDSAQTATIMESSGGSRTEYRYHTSWLVRALAGAGTGCDSGWEEVLIIV